MKYFKLYHPLSEELYEKYEKLNYLALEEICGLRPDEEFKAELFHVRLNSSGQERRFRYDFRSEALDLFMHDIVSPESPFNKQLYPVYEALNSEEVYFRVSAEEDEEGRVRERELRIMCCEDMINKIAKYASPKILDGIYLIEAYSRSFSFRFALPENVPPRIFGGADLEIFTSPLMQYPGQFRLRELGPENICRCALVPFYCELARDGRLSDTPESRDLFKYSVSLA